MYALIKRDSISARSKVVAETTSFDQALESLNNYAKRFHLDSTAQEVIKDDHGVTYIFSDGRSIVLHITKMRG